MELPPHTTTLVLPKNDAVRILAVSVTRENPQAYPAQPLYDTLKCTNTRAYKAVKGSPQ